MMILSVEHQQAFVENRDQFSALFICLANDISGLFVNLMLQLFGPAIQLEVDLRV